MSADFAIDAQLSRLLLQAQGDPITDLRNLPDGAFAGTGREAGARMVAAVADLGYRFQHERSEREDDGHTPGPRMPIARISGFGCAWIDPNLCKILAHDFGLDADRHGSLVAALVVQFFAHVLGNPVSGDFGQVLANANNGELSLDVAPFVPHP